MAAEIFMSFVLNSTGKDIDTIKTGSLKSRGDKAKGNETTSSLEKARRRAEMQDDSSRWWHNVVYRCWRKLNDRALNAQYERFITPYSTEERHLMKNAISKYSTQVLPGPLFLRRLGRTRVLPSLSGGPKSIKNSLLPAFGIGKLCQKLSKDYFLLILRALLEREVLIVQKLHEDLLRTIIYTNHLNGI